MKYCLLIVCLLTPVSLWAQCSNTAYGGGFTCVQAPIAIANGTGGSGSTVTVSFANTTTAGDGVLIYGDYCALLNCTALGSPLANVTVTDDVGDTGFQPCANNGSPGPLRYFYCWWLPAVGAAKTFVMHAAPSYGATLWIAEFSGGCNTTACIGTDTPVLYCMGPCGAQIVTTFTNVLVTGFGVVGGTFLTPATGWKTISTAQAGTGIANFQATPGPYMPGFTNTVMFNTLACSIKSRSNSVATQVTVPAMPVY